jgi:hypothetical protein
MTSRFFGRRLLAVVILATLATPGLPRTTYLHTAVGNIDVVSSMPEERTSRFLHELIGLREIIEDVFGVPVTQSAAQVIVFGSQAEMNDFFPAWELDWLKYSVKWQALMSPEGDTFAIINEWPNDKVFRQAALKEYAAHLINRTLPGCPYWIYDGLASFLCTLEYRDGVLRLGESIINRRDIKIVFSERLPLTETLDKVWMSRDVPALWHLWLTQDYEGNRPKLRQLAHLIRAGAPGNSATVAQAFGQPVAAMQEALYKHMRHIREVTIDRPTLTTGVAGRIAYHPATDFEITVAKSHILISLEKRPPELAASLKALAAANPDSPRPWEALARLATAESRRPIALLGPLTPANEIPPDAISHWLEACARDSRNPYAYLVGLRRVLEPRSSLIDLRPSLPEARIAELRQFADRCATLNPGDPDGFLWSAWLEALAPQPDPTRVDAIERTDTRFLRPGALIPLAIANIRLGRFDHASPLLDEYQQRLGDRAKNQAAVDFLRKRIAVAAAP